MLTKLDNRVFYNQYLIMGILTISVILIIVCLLIHLARWKNMVKKIDRFDEIIDGMNELFHQHFKTTDKTILDTRKERDYWKKEALKE